jgi:hypothetical protein
MSKDSQGSLSSPVSLGSPQSVSDYSSEYNVPLSPVRARDAVKNYFVNTDDKTIKDLTRFPNYVYKYTEDADVNFFQDLPRNAGGGIFPPGEERQYFITELMKERFPDDDKHIKDILSKLKSKKGASRRRRPSRKYKKSKRVLRRKSRSTRRR